MKLIKKEEIENQTCYDISVADTNNFFANGVLVHNSNASVCLSEGQIYAQKKTGKITVEKDNFGFAFFVESNKESFKKILKTIFERANLDPNKHILTLYGEWAGKGVQKTVAISELDKAFYGFGCKVSPLVEEEFDAYWLDSSLFKDLDDTDNKIYNLHQFPTYKVEVDFEQPHHAQKEFEDLTLMVEKECPVSKQLGVSGLGEGLVWTADYKGQRLIHKTKGDKHVQNKLNRKQNKESTQEIIEKTELANKVTPDWRLEQFLNDIFNLNNGGDLDKTRIGNYIKAVTKDILEEDLDIITNSKYEYDDIKKYINTNIVKYFNMLYNKL